MGYNIIDILNKAIKIEQKSKEVNMAINNKEDIPTLRLIRKVFLKQSTDTIIYYENIKSGLNNVDLKDIDIMTYDKISFLINEFNNSICLLKFSTTREYLYYTRDLAKNKYALFIDIQGRLFNNCKDKDSVTYKVLSEIISKTKNQAECIERAMA